MSDKTDEFLKTRLIAENEEYKYLHEEHLKLEAQVDKLVEKKYLSPDEEMELKRLKKIKMSGKEKMYQIIGQSK